MPHLRKRLTDEFYQKVMAYSPLVGVLGHRQVGKTTFVSAKANQYYTLDDEDVLRKIQNKPKEFIKKINKFPTVLDECQIVPELFPALKERVRTNKKTGQIILTGSVRFSSRKAIRESLTGRIINMELYPLIVSELMQSNLVDLVPRLVKTKSFQDRLFEFFPSKTETNKTYKYFVKYLSNGGLPGICFVRDTQLKQQALTSLHQLILDRDIRLIVETKLSYETLHKFLQFIANNTFNYFNAAEVKRKMGLSHQTQKQLLYAFESIFLIRRIPITSRSGEIILLEDQFEEYFLTAGNLPRHIQVLTAFYRNIRAQFNYRLGSSLKFESYWTKSGARVPLVIRNEHGALGIICIEGSKPTLVQKRAADSFLRKESLCKIIYITESNEQPIIQDERSLICPVASLIA